MKKLGLILICVCMASLFAAGCNKGKTAGGPGAAAMKQLCEKTMQEAAAASGGDMASEMQNQMGKMCERMGGMFKGNDKAAEAYANHIMTTCDGKTGKDWMDCYTQELPMAQQAATDAAK